VGIGIGSIHGKRNVDSEEVQKRGTGHRDESARKWVIGTIKSATC
jgi:hypothetical protein